jgi:hypothetical protein
MKEEIKKLLAELGHRWKITQAIRTDGLKWSQARMP